jgi:hypothetical protein
MYFKINFLLFLYSDTRVVDLNFLKKLLEAYNFDCKFLENLNKEQNQSLFEKLKTVEFYDTQKLKKKSKLIIFIITKKYVDSGLFKKHLEEANELQKEIKLIFKESDCITNLEEEFKFLKYYSSLKITFNGFNKKAKVMENFFKEKVDNKKVRFQFFIIKILKKTQIIFKGYTASKKSHWVYIPFK